MFALIYLIFCCLYEKVISFVETFFIFWQKYMAWFVVFTSFFFLLSCNKLELIGEFSVSDWTEKTSLRVSSIEDDKFDIVTLDKLKNAFNNDSVSCIIACASWCRDTKEQAPKYLAICDYLGLTDEKVKLFGISINKKEPADLIKNYNIEYVPTMILIKEGKEIGRIVESPEDSWEEDMLKIIEKSVSK